eukprot:TRINITY_DN2935_c0_g2_i1.p1 TRINITY_DN2935_c0_g2~~TRINITY_DN2935_c0_g2_i1.p1  ORF type:complete len:175 (-),score=49.15 TRINITY_DN2935_c0_g2_i1:69-557(-)
MSAVPAWKLKKQQEEEERKKQLEEEKKKKQAGAGAGAGLTESGTEGSTKQKPGEKSEHYILVAEAIRSVGKPNPSYPKDLDIEYGTLLKMMEEKNVSGLIAVLKVMKTQKRIDYLDTFLKDDSIVTLIEDYNQDIKTSLITYDQLQTVGATEKTSHQKTSGW